MDCLPRGRREPGGDGWEGSEARLRLAGYPIVAPTNEKLAQVQRRARCREAPEPRRGTVVGSTLRTVMSPFVNRTSVCVIFGRPPHPTGRFRCSEQRPSLSTPHAEMVVFHTSEAG